MATFTKEFCVLINARWWYQQLQRPCCWRGRGRNMVERSITCSLCTRPSHFLLTLQAAKISVSVHMPLTGVCVCVCVCCSKIQISIAKLRMAVKYDSPTSFKSGCIGKRAFLRYLLINTQWLMMTFFNSLSAFTHCGVSMYWSILARNVLPSSLTCQRDRHDLLCKNLTRTKHYISHARISTHLERGLVKM